MFHKNFVKILRIEFATEHLLVDAIWPLLIICLVFFDHCFVLLISSNVIEMFFPQEFKP